MGIKEKEIRYIFFLLQTFGQKNTPLYRITQASYLFSSSFAKSLVNLRWWRLLLPQGKLQLQGPKRRRDITTAICHFFLLLLRSDPRVANYSILNLFLRTGKRAQELRPRIAGGKKIHLFEINGPFRETKLPKKGA